MEFSYLVIFILELLGTVAFAVLIGPLVHRALPWCDTRLPAAPAPAPAA